MRNFLTKRTNDNPWAFNFFDDFEDFFKPVFVNRNYHMSTDIKENDKEYELSIDMPGYDKKDITLTLDKGYLTISAKRDENQEDGYIKRERSLSCSRSFFVGDNVTEEDVKAKYLNGTLSLTVPKKEKKEISAKNIVIE